MTKEIKVVYQYHSESSRHGGGSEELDVSFYNSKTGIKVNQIIHPTMLSHQSNATLETIAEDQIKNLEKIGEINEQNTCGKRSYHKQVKRTTIKFEEFEDFVAKLESAGGIKTGFLTGHFLSEINFKWANLNTIACAYFSLDESRDYLSKVYNKLKTKIQ